MGISSVYNFVFYLPDGTPNNHSLVCERFPHGRFIFQTDNKILSMSEKFENEW
jgi:hypothetical protein